MKRSRVISMLLVIVMIAALLCACTGQDGGEADGAVSSGGTGNAGGTNEGANSTLDYFPLDEPVTLSVLYTLWFGHLSGYGIDGADDLKFYIEMENRTNIDLEIETMMLSAAQMNYSILIAGDDLPDIIQNATYFHVGGIANAVADETVLELSDIINDYMPNYASVINSLDIYKKDTMDDSGIVAAIYAMNENDYGKMGPLIRSDWLERVGMESPVTYEDYYNVLTAFKVELGVKGAMAMSPCGVPYANYLIAGYDTYGHISTGSSYGLFYQTDGEVMFGPTSEGFREYLTMMNQWWNEDLIYQDFLTAEDAMNSASDNMINNGEVGIFYGGTASISRYPSTNVDENAAFAGISDAKRTADQQLHIRSREGYVTSNAWSFTTSMDSGKIEPAARFFDYIYSEEGQLLSNYGVEGVTFEYVDGGIVFTELVTNNPDGMAASTVLEIYCISNTVGLIDAHRNDSITTDAELAAYSLWNSADTEYMISMRTSQTAEETSELAEYYPDIETYVEEMMVKFILGYEDIETGWDNYIKTIEGMDIARCLEIKQDVYNRYLAR